jgi:hypothetical protein
MWEGIQQRRAEINTPQSVGRGNRRGIYMTKQCPYCEEKIEYLEVSKQIEGTQRVSGLQNIEWNEEQKEPVIYSCPVCLAEIGDETIEKWGLA